MLYFVRYVSLDIWRVEQYACFWPLWFNKPTTSSTYSDLQWSRFLLYMRASYTPLCYVRNVAREK